MTGDSGLGRLVEGRRFRSLGPETPARPETPGTLRGCSGPTPERHHTYANSREKARAGDSGSSGPETPVDRRFRVIWPETPVGPETPDHLRCNSGLATGRHHSKTHGSEKLGTGDSGSFGRRLRWPETPDHLRTSFSSRLRFL